MITEYFQSLFLIFVAEMGDKTQILAMMFATQFKVSKVFIGIFIGSLLNHGLAVAFGSYIGGMIPSFILQMIAGTAFIGFAIWTLRESDEEKKETSSHRSYGAVITVALAFFVGELGDKTQLTAITLAVDAVFPIIVLMGTVSGMLVTSGIGIVIGSQLGDKIPDVFIKIASGSVFMIFGIIKLYNATPSNYVNPYTVTIFIGVIGYGILLLIKKILEIKNSGQDSVYNKEK